MLIVMLIVLAAAGSVLPLSPIEPVLLALPAIVSPELLIPLALLAGAAHMTGKVALYFGSERLMRFIPSASAATANRVRAQLERRPVLRGAWLLVSAFLGVPSFYAVTVIAGALKVPLSQFTAIGFVGRSARFLVLVGLPQLFVSLF